MKRIFLISGVIVIILLGSLYLKKSQGDVVEFGKNGFSPAGVKVNVGTKVKFINRSNQNVWIASDVHPANDIYPDFNSGKGLSPGESWEFVFSSQGTFRYHNHLSPDQRGTVQVVAGDSSSNDCGALDDREARLNCWMSYFQTVVIKKGSEKALELLKKYREESPEFAADCHTVSHSLGEAAYWVYAKDKKLPSSGKVATCGYGFIHGFMQEFGHHDKNFQSAAAGLCDHFSQGINYQGEEKSVDPMDQCYHGVGHGLAFYYTPDYWGREEDILKKGAEDCRQLTDDAKRINDCVYGLFGGVMNLYTGGHGYKLELDLKDPFAICRRQEPDLKEACYDSLAPTIWVFTGRDIEKTLDYYRKVGERQYLRQAMYNFGDLISPRFVLGEVSQEKALSSCLSLDGELATSCLRGFAEGLIRNGFPQNAVDAAFNFCSSNELSSSQKDACLEGVFAEIKLSYADKLEAICAQNQSNYAKYCQK